MGDTPPPPPPPEDVVDSGDEEEEQEADENAGGGSTQNQGSLQQQAGQPAQQQSENTPAAVNAGPTVAQAVAVAAPAQTGSTKKSPSDFLKTVLGRPVVVKLNSGIDYRGVLACLDGYMNIAMEQTEEYVNGQLKAKYGDCFIRGNNVLYISTQKRR